MTEVSVQWNLIYVAAAGCCRRSFTGLASNYECIYALVSRVVESLSWLHKHVNSVTIITFLSSFTLRLFLSFPSLYVLSIFALFISSRRFSLSNFDLFPFHLCIFDLPAAFSHFGRSSFFLCSRTCVSSSGEETGG